MAYLISGLYLNYLVASYNLTLDIGKIDLMETISKDSSINHGLRYSRFSEDIDDPIVIMGHSGFGDNALFNDLIYLNKGDLISLHYLKKTKVYEVTNIIKFTKFNSININKNKDYLYLVTCDLNDYTKQYLIEAKTHKED